MYRVLLAGPGSLQHGLAHVHLQPAEEVRKPLPWQAGGVPACSRSAPQPLDVGLWEQDS